MLERVHMGFWLAAGIALIARRAGSLSNSGAVAATFVGSLAVLAGWGWAVVLIAYFITTSAISRIGAASKESRVAAVIAKPGARDAAQVISNGGIFALSACAYVWSGAPLWAVAAVGALATSSSDSWATELGTLWGGRPISILTMKHMAPGTSGGVSVVGCMGMIAGAAFVAELANVLHLETSFSILFAAGIAGALVDSLLGATIQHARWCDACDQKTERHAHSCGAPTRPAGGYVRLDNDAVNFLSTIVGAGVAAALTHL